MRLKSNWFALCVIIRETYQDFFDFQVIHNGVKKVEKEYNDLPLYAELLSQDPKLTDDDRKRIRDDLDSYKIRYDQILLLVSEREQA